MSSGRRGFIILVVAGAAAILATMALAFIVRMRLDARETAALVGYTQARLMYYAACSYILEAGRIGWETDTYTATGAVSGTARHEETFGWVDVRNGKTGPLRLPGDAEVFAAGGSAANVFPKVGGRAGRFPMGVCELPPFAIRRRDPNPINTDPAHADFGLPILQNPDPQPVARPPVANGSVTGSVDAVVWRFGRQRGALVPSQPDPEIRWNSRNLCWFRILRDSPATFVITCGAGSTKGYRDWAEVVALGATAEFPFGQRVFEQILAEETRLWYRIEWSPAIPNFDQKLDYRNAMNGLPDVRPVNAQHDQANHMNWTISNQNVVGTISWSQRLPLPPVNW